MTKGKKEKERKKRDKIEGGGKSKSSVDGGLLERRGRCQQKSKPSTGARDSLPTTLRNLDDFLQEGEEGRGTQC